MYISAHIARQDVRTAIQMHLDTIGNFVGDRDVREHLDNTIAGCLRSNLAKSFWRRRSNRGVERWEGTLRNFHLGPRPNRPYCKRVVLWTVQEQSIVFWRRNSFEYYKTGWKARNDESIQDANHWKLVPQSKSRHQIYSHPTRSEKHWLSDETLGKCWGKGKWLYLLDFTSVSDYISLVPACRKENTTTSSHTQFALAGLPVHVGDNQPMHNFNF